MLVKKTRFELAALQNMIRLWMTCIAREQRSKQLEQNISLEMVTMQLHYYIKV